MKEENRSEDITVKDEWTLRKADKLKNNLSKRKPRSTKPPKRSQFSVFVSFQRPRRFQNSSKVFTYVFLQTF
jgi:hypothetical protein